MSRNSLTLPSRATVLFLAAVTVLLTGTARPARAQVAFQPTVSSFPDGVGLSVSPVVSADRRYVRMGINPVFTGLQGFDPFSVPAAVGGTGFAGMNGLTGPGGGGGGNGGGGGGPAGFASVGFGPRAGAFQTPSPDVSALLAGRAGYPQRPSLVAGALKSGDPRLAPAAKTRLKRPSRSKGR